MCTINLCDNGVVDEGEDCDLGSGNGLIGSQCTFTCQSPSILNLERFKDLVASCDICPPEVKGSLLDILSRTRSKLDKENLRSAFNTLKQFMKKVQHFLSKGQLPAAEGRQLQTQAEVIIAQLEEQLAGR